MVGLVGLLNALRTWILLRTLPLTTTNRQVCRSSKITYLQLIETSGVPRTRIMDLSSLPQEPSVCLVERDHISAHASFDLLPVEIITEIFLVRCWSNSSTAGLDITPVILSSVCRRWRDIALTTQRMWQQLDPAWDAEGLLLTQLYLQRASNCDLYIRLRYSDLPMPTTVEREARVDEEDIIYERARVTEALNYLSRHIGRWRELTLDVCFVESITAFRDLISVESASSLTNLRVSCDNLGANLDNPDVNAPKVTFYIGATPVLESLVLQGVEPQIAEESGLSKVLPTLTGITLSDLSRLSRANLARLLSHSNVEDLELEDIGFSEQETAAVSLPNLKDLSILNPDDPDDIVHLLELIRAPHLNKLAFSGFRDAVDALEVVNALEQQNASYSSIITLIVEWGSFVQPGVDDWKRLFAQFPRIERLRVNDCALSTQNLLTALSQVSQTRLHLPRLSHLDIRNASSDDILAFLESLSAQPRRARKLHLTLRDATSADLSMSTKCLELLDDLGYLDSNYVR